MKKEGTWNERLENSEVVTVRDMIGPMAFGNGYSLYQTTQQAKRRQ